MIKFNYKKRFKTSLILIGISVLLLLLGTYINNFANFYCNYVYLILVNTVSRIFSLIPFSVYEISLYSFVLFIIYRIIRYIILRIKTKISLKNIFCMAITNIILYISIFAFLNVITQGVNCLKSSFAEDTGLKVEAPSEENLAEFCEYIKDNLNYLDTKINKDQNGKFKLENNYGKIGIENMKNLSKTYPVLSGFYPNPKKYIFSDLMSYQLLQGETTFTIEANYNNNMPSHNIPSTICHELTHIRGFNNEDEANYVSFLACINGQDYNYKYSAYLMAYDYCMSDLYYINKDKFIQVNDELSKNVKTELQEDDIFWKPYRGNVSKIYDFIYDKLLKMVGQKDGIKSYNGVVKLLTSGYKVQFK